MAFRTPGIAGLAVAPNAPGDANNPPASAQELQQTAFWGRFALATQLPNASANAASAPAYDQMRPGDMAWVQATDSIYWLQSRGTLGGADAVWVPAGSSGGGTLELALRAQTTGTTPLVVGAVYLVVGQVLGAASRALIGTAGSGDAKLQLRRESTGVLLAGASWTVTGVIADTVLGASVIVPATDWYTLELFGDSSTVVSFALGASLV